jgi:hypothetical protein
MGLRFIFCEGFAERFRNLLFSYFVIIFIYSVCAIYLCRIYNIQKQSSLLNKIVPVKI